MTEEGFQARCLSCGQLFRARHGSGFVFHLLRCDRCGAEKRVHFGDLGEVHLGYIKGLDGALTPFTASYDEFVQANYRGDPVGEHEYLRRVERHAGECECGGAYSLRAPIRCPSCRATEFLPLDQQWGA